MYIKHHEEFMGRIITTARRGAGLALVAMLTLGASGPRALAPASPGLWEVGHSAKADGERMICVPDPVLLGQIEHRGGACSRTILSDEGDKVVIDYTCRGGGFGRSEMTLLTPRSLRISTQGISAGGPFNYVIHARRVGDCQFR